MTFSPWFLWFVSDDSLPFHLRNRSSSFCYQIVVRETENRQLLYLFISTAESALAAGVPDERRFCDRWGGSRGPRRAPVLRLLGWEPGSPTSAGFAIVGVGAGVPDERRFWNRWGGVTHQG